MNLCTPILIVIAAIIITTVESGSCQPLLTWGTAEANYGYTQPACTTILSSSQFTHYWLNDKDIPDIDSNRNAQSPCLTQTAFIYDEPAQSLFQIMKEDTPSLPCQQVLGLTMCFAQFHSCDPLQDGVKQADGTNGPYVTEKKNKPCKYLCELVKSDKSLCTISDREYLNNFGVDLDATVASIPQLDCDNEDYWSQDSVECFAPSGLLPVTVAPRCEEYRGSQCAAVYPSGTMVYVPGAVEQETIEQYLPFRIIFASLPIENNDCIGDWSSHQCQFVFPECVEHGMSYYKADPSTGYPVLGSKGTKLKHPLPLRTSMASCDDYTSSCSTTPFFSSPSVRPLFTFHQCETNHHFHYKRCFPPLDETMAIDYVPPSPSTPMMVTATTTTYEPHSTLADNSATPVTATTTSGYTVAQTKIMNRVRAVYQMNAKAYFDPLAYEDYALFGPQSNDPAVLFGQIRGASFRHVDDSALPISSNCPLPLVVPSHYKDDEVKGSTNLFRGRCALPCPNAAYTDKERKIIRRVSWAFVTISLAGSAMLLLSLFIFNSQRHKRLLFWYTLTYFGAIAFMFQGLFIKYPNQCEDQTHRGVMRGFGLYQSLFLLYFLVSSTAWWCMQAVDLLERLILGRVYKHGSSSDKKRNIAMHLFCWGMPLLCVIAVGVGEQFGYDGLLPFAFITTRPDVTSRPIHLSWAFFFVPVITLFVIGIVCVAIVLFFLQRYDPTDGLKKFNNNVEKAQNSYYKLGQFIKLFGFVLLIIVFIILFLIYQITVGEKADHWHDVLVVWGESTLLYNGSNISVPPITDRMPIGLIIMTVFAFSSPGWVMFILYFIASNDIIRLWCGIFHFKMGLGVCKRWAKEDTRTDSSTGSASNGSNGSSDILTGDIVLKKNTHNSVESLTLASVDHTRTQISSKPTTTTSSKPSTAIRDAHKASSPHNHHEPQHGRHHRGPNEQERRNNLFKGFKNKGAGSNGGSSSGFSQPRLESSPSFDRNQSGSDPQSKHAVTCGLEMVTLESSFSESLPSSSPQQSVQSLSNSSPSSSPPQFVQTLTTSASSSKKARRKKRENLSPVDEEFTDEGDEYD